MYGQKFRMLRRSTTITFAIIIYRSIIQSLDHCVQRRYDGLYIPSWTWGGNVALIDGYRVSSSSFLLHYYILILFRLPSSYLVKCYSLNPWKIRNTLKQINQSFYFHYPSSFLYSSYPNPHLTPPLVLLSYHILSSHTPPPKKNSDLDVLERRWRRRLETQRKDHAKKAATFGVDEKGGTTAVVVVAAATTYIR